jgi:hypothetical protein
MTITMSTGLVCATPLGILSKRSGSAFGIMLRTQQGIRKEMSMENEIARAIKAQAIQGQDAAGGTVDSLTEAVMGITAGLFAIAEAQGRVADALESIHLDSFEISGSIRLEADKEPGALAHGTLQGFQILSDAIRASAGLDRLDY